MKTKSHLTFAIISSILLLAGCGKSDAPKSATPSATAAAAPAANAPAEGRPIRFTANDTMKFNMTEIRAKPGEALAVTLRNEGTMPKFSMGHNWVLLAPGVNLLEFASDAGLAAKTDYVPASYNDRILAHIKLLGPGESATVLFYAPKEPGSYDFLCSFPGHMQVGMKGKLIVE